MAGGIIPNVGHRKVPRFRAISRGKALLTEPDHHRRRELASRVVDARLDSLRRPLALAASCDHSIPHYDVWLNVQRASLDAGR